MTSVLPADPAGLHCGEPGASGTMDGVLVLPTGRVGLHWGDSQMPGVDAAVNSAPGRPGRAPLRPLQPDDMRPGTDVLPAHEAGLHCGQMHSAKGLPLGVALPADAGLHCGEALLQGRPTTPDCSRSRGRASLRIEAGQRADNRFDCSRPLRPGFVAARCTARTGCRSATAPGPRDRASSRHQARRAAAY